jgi:hypothetical protein
MGMICAMGAISILGFIVWAQLGLPMRKYRVIKLCYMLETLLNNNSNGSVYINFLSHILSQCTRLNLFKTFSLAPLTKGFRHKQDKMRLVKLY